MCLIAEVVAPLSALPFGSAVEDHDVELELERSVPPASRAMSFVWVRGPDAASFGEAVRSLPGVDDLTLVGSVSDRSLYGVTWDVSQIPVFDALVERDAVLLECLSTADSWWLKLRVSSHRVLTDLRREWAAHGIDTEFDRISSVAAEEEPMSGRLTDTQLEALLLALDRGYFDERRDTSLDELGAELGISRQAVAARLKRAYRTLAERIRDERSPR
ncbi:MULTISPECIES: helix-turn-helix domain-containing protein [Haloferax]|uniref:HTH DNA binding domain protein n=1 Tax=Haloferax massiliensis TaxID=1476858 RepID=A0A0D6JS43_9EURY|nr:MULTISPECIES: helix-turn-helix domain-containing protein [Haloferax]MDS0240618.1 helix-turn-helix domain-containing protein [Haloferax sp. S2CR25]MDS0443739.1 helix-turn-helix domain-containing protein [Haloferax sp. S2CR25-2]CQR50741.1 HTH DNA binding domain protein [Haloferax massiliensis]